MLTITLPGGEQWDSVNEMFLYTDPKTVRLEHSLLAISKWEAKWKKPFLSALSQMTKEEAADYVVCMSVDNDITYDDVICIDSQTLTKIYTYVGDPQSATTIKQRGKNSRQIVTSELIYSWMVNLQIPFDPCETWHLQRLMKLIGCCGAQNNPEKMSQKDIIQQNRELNAQRRAMMNSSG